MVQDRVWDRDSWFQDLGDKTMILIWGSTFYGKTDEVPGLFHVATRFGHLWYIPLIPLGSYLLLQDGGDESHGVQVPFSFKSLALGWLRAGTVLLAIFALIGGIATAQEGGGWSLFGTAGLAVAGFVVLKFGRAFRHASYDRATELEQLIGLSEAGQVMLDVHYGMIDEREAEARLAEAETADLAEAERELARRRAELERGDHD